MLELKDKVGIVSSVRQQSRKEERLGNDRKGTGQTRKYVEMREKSGIKMLE